MTQNFYYNFLEYLSPKEKTVLLGNIQKHKARIDGFRTIKDVPTKLLASYFVKNEKVLFQILKECYSPEYSNEEDALNNFSPESAVMCFVYLIREGKTSEDVLLPLMKKKNIEQSSDLLDESGEKNKKKSDEFRKKYLTTYKTLEQTMEQIEGLKNENQRLRTELEEKTKSVLLLEEDAACRDKEQQEIVSAMQKRIDELEEECSRLKYLAYMKERRILVISNSVQTSLVGVTVLPYDRIGELDYMASSYSEILYVPNDMPFSSRRYIQKLANIEEKIHLFYTYSELVEYLENRR